MIHADQKYLHADTCDDRMIGEHKINDIPFEVFEVVVAQKEKIQKISFGGCMKKMDKKKMVNNHFR